MNRKNRKMSKRKRQNKILLLITISNLIRNSKEGPYGTNNCKSIINQEIKAISFRDEQALLLTHMDSEGKTGAAHEPIFELDACKGNDDYHGNHVYYVMGWVKVEKGMYLAPKSTTHQSMYDSLMAVQIEECPHKVTYSYDGNTPIEFISNPAFENNLKLMEVDDKQSWIFYIWYIVKTTRVGGASGSQYVQYEASKVYV